MEHENEAELIATIPEAVAEADKYSVSPAIHRDDFIYHHHIVTQTDPDPDRARAIVTRYYFEDGDRSTGKLHELIARLHPEAGQRKLSLLEFASGYGCLSRHLGRMRDRYDLVACDIHPQAIAFLQEVIGVDAMASVSDPGAFRSERKFDVVFALSFFSHMPPTTFAAWLHALFATVVEGGILIFTTHGRIGHNNVDRPALQPEGFWFAPVSEQKDLPTTDYGCMVATPAYVLAQLMKLEAAEFVLFEEAFWWSTQDVFVVRRRTDGFTRRPESPRNDVAADLIRTFTNSTSWRITAPLRAVRSLLNKPGAG